MDSECANRPGITFVVSITVSVFVIHGKAARTIDTRASAALHGFAMANSLDDRIRARVEQFAAELAELIRESAMETVSAALAGARPSPGRGGRRAAAAPVVAARGAGRSRAAAASREKGAKRPPDEIERLTERLLDYVKGNPGQRIEQIADGMGTSTKELNLPAKKLIAGKQLKTKGQKRATQYFSR